MKGWTTKKLREVCVKGDLPKATVGSTPYVEIGDVDVVRKDIVFKAKGAVKGSVVAPAKSVLVSRVRPTRGAITIIENDSAVSSAFSVLRPTSELELRLLFHRLAHSPDFNDHLSERQKGLLYPSVKEEDVLDYSIAFPVSLAEQQRIVGLLDEALAGLASARAHAERNYLNARALFESHLHSVFTQRGIGWIESTIGAEIRFIDYRGRTPVKTASGIRLITAKNVKMGYLQESPMEFIAAESYESWMTRGIPKKGDVLFTTEAPLANVAQLDTDEKVAFAQRIIVMQPNAERLDCTFLKYLLLAQPVQNRIRAKGTGATVKGIKASLLKTIDISFPNSLAEQESIAATLDTLAEETQRLATLYEQKLAALESLKHSLLHQAFTGKL